MLTAERPKYNELIRRVREHESASDEPEVRIAVLRNFTCDQTVQCLRYGLQQSGLRPEIFMGEYDQIMQPVLDPGSVLYRHRPEIIVLALYGPALWPEEMLRSDFPDADLHQLDEILNRYSRILQAIRKTSKAMVLLHNHEVPVFPVLGILDAQREQGGVNRVLAFNSALRSLAESFVNVHVVDVNRLQARIGYENGRDMRYWHMARAPYTYAMAYALAGEYYKFILAAKGMSRKCLVLDCDNTLWGGIVGEEGWDGIQLGRQYPGSAFRQFQQTILALHRRGVVLAIASKNNPEDVDEVFEKNREMLLKREHFAVMKVNWSDKAANVREIAHEINIGTDSLVFVDDSAFEVERMKQALPEVMSLQLPAEPSQYADVLLSAGLFDSLTFTVEDGKRTEMLRADMERRSYQQQENFQDVSEYLTSLEMVLTVEDVGSDTLPRVLQLVQRTNQFNLTTRRHSQADLEAMCQSDAFRVRLVRLSDRFGEYGIVGVCILKLDSGEAVIDTLLLSCRALGRGVEEAMLADAVSQAAAAGKDIIIGEYVATRKNAQVEEFYSFHGFLKSDGQGDAVQYKGKLSEISAICPDYLKVSHA